MSVQPSSVYLAPGKRENRLMQIFSGSGMVKSTAYLNVYLFRHCAIISKHRNSRSNVCVGEWVPICNDSKLVYRRRRLRIFHRPSRAAPQHIMGKSSSNLQFKVTFDYFRLWLDTLCIIQTESAEK